MTLGPATLIPRGRREWGAEGLAGGHPWVSFQTRVEIGSQGIDMGLCPSGAALLGREDIGWWGREILTHTHTHTHTHTRMHSERELRLKLRK